MSKRLIRIALILLAGLGAAQIAHADTMNLGRFVLAPGQAVDTYNFSGQVYASKRPQGEIAWPDNCTVLEGGRQLYIRMMALDYTLSCPDGLADEDVIHLPWGQDGGVLTSRLGGDETVHVIPGSEAGLDIGIGAGSAVERPLHEVAGEYTWLGIIHILEGWDHLAFITCLCLLAGGSTLLWLVTAFTLGHSLSLALSFFDVVSIPVPPVEAVIALSIAVMAREAVAAWRSGLDVRRALGRYVAVVATFGLLHGLGFASVLGDIGVSPGEQVTGLVFFNVGVEVGQLFFIGVLTAIALLARLVHVQTPLRYAAVFLVGALGCFWTIERMTGIILSV